MEGSEEGKGEKGLGGRLNGGEEEEEEVGRVK
jgi:hypothetical protein